MYYRLALDYWAGLLSGDTSVFLAMAEHPPLAILLLGVFHRLLVPFGIESAKLAERGFAAVCLGFVCVVSYWIAARRLGRGAGLVAWLLTAGQLLIIPYEMWAKGPYSRAELNGFTLTWTGGAAAPYFQFAPTVLSTMVFVSLSMHYLIDHDENGNLVKAGICYGLASLMNQAVPPTLLLVCFLWVSFNEGVRRAVVKTARYGIIGLVFMVLGNPVFWDIGNLPEFFERFQSGPSAYTAPFGPSVHTANFFYVLLKSMFFGGRFYGIPGGDEALTVVYYVLTGVFLYWVKIFIELWLFQIFLILVLLTAVRGKKAVREQVLFLLWFSVMFFFLSAMFKPVCFVEPHLDYFIPPLALYCTYTLCEHFPQFRENI